MAFTQKTKIEAWMRDKGRCRGVKQNNYTCGVKLKSMQEAEFDHIEAQYLDGGNTLDNCATLCIPCHRLKTNGSKATTYGSDKHESAKVKRLKGETGQNKKKKKINSPGFRGHRKFNGDIVWRD